MKFKGDIIGSKNINLSDRTMIQYKSFIESLGFSSILVKNTISDEIGDTIVLKLVNTSCGNTPGHLYSLLNILENLQEHIYNLFKIIKIDIRITEWKDYDDYSIVKLFIDKNEFEK